MKSTLKSLTYSDIFNAVEEGEEDKVGKNPLRGPRIIINKSKPYNNKGKA
jgi:hypothetical protein